MVRPVVVSGVPGVGASRVCQEARRTLGEGVTLINFGDVMLEEALERGLARSRDDLAGLPAREQRILQRRAGEFVAREATGGPLLVNTHLVVHTVHGFVPGLPDAVLDDLDPAAFVVVDAPVETVEDQRRASERSYLDESTAEVSFHRQLQTAAAMTYSAETDAPVRYVSSQRGAEAAGEELAAMVEAAVGP